MIWTRETIWTTHDGRRRALGELEDTHLANLIQYMSKMLVYKPSLLKLLKDIAKERGLKQEFLERSQIPYKNKHNKWEIYNFEEHTFQEIEDTKKYRYYVKRGYFGEYGKVYIPFWKYLFYKWVVGIAVWREK